MNLIHVSIILPILSFLTYYLIRDFKKGLCIAVFLFASLTARLSIETFGNFPDLTIHRLILLLIFIFWTVKNKSNVKFVDIPFIYLMILVGIANLISLIVSVEFVFSLKSYLSFTIEIIIFYIIMTTTVSDEKYARRMLNYICFALFLVAFLAVIEKYTGFNPVDTYVHGYVRKEKYVNDVMSTYSHRILLGTAMAMGWPIAISLIDFYKDYPFRKVSLWIAACSLVSSCYFAYSRGPWIASLIAALIMFILGTSGLKNKLLIVAVIAICTMVIRPGIWDTIGNLAEATMDPYSAKGSSYEWRWELWRKAFYEISKSTERALFGYGPGVSEAMDLHGSVSFLDVEDDFWSWDNHYAANLLEGGYVGFGILIILYTVILKKLYTIWRVSNDSYKNLLASIIASVAVMLFMMTNVKIFAPQLNYIFWTLISIGTTLSVKEIASTPETLNGEKSNT